MVRISSKRSPQQKTKSVDPQPIEIHSNPTDQSSSKILNVVRQALLNAAEELVSQQENPIPFDTLDINNNDSNKTRQQNGNAIKKKNKKKVKINRRK